MSSRESYSGFTPNSQRHVHNCFTFSIAFSLLLYFAVGYTVAGAIPCSGFGMGCGDSEPSEPEQDREVLRGKDWLARVRDELTKKIYVGNLPFSSSEEDVRRLFAT